MSTHAPPFPTHATPFSIFASAFGAIARVFTYGVCALLLWRSLHPAFYYMEWIVLPFVLVCVLFPLAINLAVNGKVHPHWAYPVIFLVLLGAACVFKLPMKLAFLTLRPQLAKITNATPPAKFTGLTNDIASPIFRISAKHTTAFNGWKSEAGCDNSKRILFILADDSEAGFIYSPGGISDLCYNSGNSGHLMGPWYWMKAD
jgi:hypothetical protein